MYKPVETVERVAFRVGDEGVRPVATLRDEHGGEAHVVVDDHCLMLVLKQKDGTVKSTPWLFKEAVEVIQELPLPE